MADSTLIASLNQELQELRQSGRYKEAGELQSPQGPRVTLDVRPTIRLSSNNYLGLAGHPEVVKAAHQALDDYGNGTASVRFICGTMTIHHKIERAIAEFLEVEAALTFISCWDANVGLVPTLVARGDAVFSDALNHASIIDAVRLTKAERIIYPHGDLKALEDGLKAHRQAPRKLIITDGIFSMEGDLAPLPDLVEIAERHDAVLAVDESHATGVLGEHGRGTTEHFGLLGRVDIQTSTLGKALGGACGGYVAGKRAVIDYLLQRSRPHLFSNALPPPVCGASLAALEILRREPERLKRLHDNSTYFRSGITDLGLETIEGLTPIVPVMLGETELAIRFQKSLQERGVFVSGFGYPVVPQGEARLRAQVSAAHSREELDLALEAFEASARELGIVR